MPPPPPPRAPRPVAAGGGGGGDAGGRSALSKVLRILGIIVASAAASAAAAPTVLSSRPGKRAALTVANRSLRPAKLSIDSLHLRWRHPPDARGVKLVDGASGATVAAAERVGGTASLAAALLGGRPFDVVVAKPYVDLTVPDATGATRLQRALGLAPPLDDGDDDDSSPLAGVPADRSASTEAPVPPLGPPASVPFSAEARGGKKGRFRLFVADGVALVPADVAESLGGAVHAAVLAGREAIAEDGPDLLTAEPADGADPAGEPPEGVYDASWAMGGKLWRSAVPLAADLRAPRARASASGWLNARSRSITLRRPIVARADLTPSLAKHALARVSPLLADAVAAEGGAPIVAALDTPNHALPSSRLSIRLAPLTLKVERGKGGGGLAGAALDWVGARSRGAVTARTTAATLDVAPGGAVTCRRVDVLLGGVHLATWGAVDAAGRRLAVTLGVPAATLARVGFKAPPGSVLPVAVRGRLATPRVDFAAATAAAAALAAEAAAAEPDAPGDDPTSSAIGALKRLLLRSAARGAGAVAAARGVRGGRGAVPPPEDLPWAPGPPGQIDAVLERQRRAAEKLG